MPLDVRGSPHNVGKSNKWVLYGRIEWKIDSGRLASGRSATLNYRRKKRWEDLARYIAVVVNKFVHFILRMTRTSSGAG